MSDRVSERKRAQNRTDDAVIGGFSSNDTLIDNVSREWVKSLERLPDVEAVAFRIKPEAFSDCTECGHPPLHLLSRW